MPRPGAQPTAAQSTSNSDGVRANKCQDGPCTRGQLQELLDASATFCGLVLRYWLGGDSSACDHGHMHNSLHHGNGSTRQPFWPYLLPLLVMIL